MRNRGRELLLRHWTFPQFSSLLRRHGISLADAAILDAGCGSGYILTLIEEFFHPGGLTAFDVHPAEVERARARNVSATIFVGDIASLQLHSEAFDAVVVCGALHQCRAWRAGLAEVARVLKDGGVLLVEEPGAVPLKLECALSSRSSGPDAGFSLKALPEEMERNGLAVVEYLPLYFGLSRGFLCVKAVARRLVERKLARGLLNAEPEHGLATG